MAQKGISYMNKVGNFQHWKDDWHSYNSHKITQQSFLFVEDIIKIFITSRNSFNSYLVDTELCWEQVNSLDCEIKDEDHNSLILAVRHQRAKRFMRLITGRVIFLRYNNWLVILVYLFIPKLLRKLSKPIRNDFIRSRQLIKSQWITSINYKNSYIYINSGKDSIDLSPEVEEDFINSDDDLDPEILTPEEITELVKERSLKLDASKEKLELKKIIRDNKINIIKLKNMYSPRITYIGKNKLKGSF